MKYRIILSVSIAILIIAVLIAIVFASLASPAKLPALSGDNVIESGNLKLAYHENAAFSIAADGETILRNVYSKYDFDGKIIKSTDYANIKIEKNRIDDNFGQGESVKFICTDSRYPRMTSIINIYSNSAITVSVELSGETQIATNCISPIVADAGNVAFNNADRFLEVPFDNDAWDTYDVKNLLFSGASSEVGCFFSEINNYGLVVGALTHNNWKNAVEHTSVSGQVKSLEAYSGAETQYDESAHGTITGNFIESEKFYISADKDWKKSLKSFAAANTAFQEKKDSRIDGVPVGFNSWGVIQSDLNLDKAIAVSDAIKNNYQNSMENAGNKVFINLDSYWDNMSDSELKAFVVHCKTNGQEAGIYWAPFVSWLNADSLDSLVEGSDNVRYSDVILKKNNGKAYGNNIDGCYPLDVTHPAVLKRMEYFLNKFVECGFTYIKLDFMSHGALEGLHYDKNIETGMQAYHYGMKKITSVIGDKMFINLSIAPIFPYEYANGRRIACDSYYKINETRYTLNALTYGFWCDELYDYPDPDHIVLWSKNGEPSFYEAQSRLLSGVISGTSLLFGDDFSELTNKDKFDRLTMINNDELMKLAGAHKSFEAVLNGKYAFAADIYKAEIGGKTYYAVFNFENKKKKISINIGGDRIVKDLFGNNISYENGNVGIILNAKQSILIEITNTESE